MKTKTVKGTAVDVYGTTGCNTVLVRVVGMNTAAQVNAEDLMKPETVTEEFAGLRFYEEKE